MNPVKPTPTPPAVALWRESGFRFRVRFDGERMPDVITDEAPPVGCGSGPSPAALLAAAVGNCLASSLLFSLKKARIEAASLEAEVEVDAGRNEQGRLRIHGLRVKLAPEIPADALERAGRCRELFESFCVITESVRHGIPVAVSVETKTAGAGDPVAAARR